MFVLKRGSLCVAIELQLVICLLQKVNSYNKRVNECLKENVYFFNYYNSILVTVIIINIAFNYF